MESAQSIPMRAAIRSRAKQQLLANPETCELCAGLDDALMRELTVTLFNSDQYKALYRQSRSSEETAEIVGQMSVELATNYRQIIQQQQNPTIQQLNMLL